MSNQSLSKPPVCADPSRRDFLQAATTIAMASCLSEGVRAAEGGRPMSENKVTELYQSLASEQKEGICFPVDHKSRSLVTLNELITDVTIDKLKPTQRDLVEKILKGLTSEEGFERFTKQMTDDADGLPGYSISFFGEPGDPRFEFVLSGRHLTQRVDGNFDDKVAFGGTLFYGHAPGAFTEDKHHEGNVFWYQAEEANKVYESLDPQQRKQSLLGKAPHESKVQHRKGPYPGIPVDTMSHEQLGLVQKLLDSTLRLYRKEDVDEANKIIKLNGGIEKLCLSFYQLTLNGKPGDIGSDGVFELWRLEGPGFAWHYRGNPHPHGWINISKV